MTKKIEPWLEYDSSEFEACLNIQIQAICLHPNNESAQQGLFSIKMIESLESDAPDSELEDLPFSFATEAVKYAKGGQQFDAGVQKLALAGEIGLRLIQQWKDSGLFTLKPVFRDVREFFSKLKAPDGSRIPCAEPTARAALKEHEFTLHFAVTQRIKMSADDVTREVLSNPFVFLKTAHAIKKLFLEMYSCKKPTLENGQRTAAREQWPDTLGHPENLIEFSEEITSTKEWRESALVMYVSDITGSGKN